MILDTVGFWKKLVSWQGWKKLLFPHKFLAFSLLPVSAAALIVVFVMGWKNTVPAYLLYALSAYALTVFIAALIPVLRSGKKAAGARMQSRNTGAAFGLDFYAEQIVNFFYGGWKLITGWLTASVWMTTDGIYNLVQAFLQLYLILRHKQADTMADKWKSYRRCGFMIIAMHMAMVGLVFQMIHRGCHEEHTEISIIATAAFTFYKLTKAVLALSWDRKHRDPVDSSVHLFSFGQALYNLFVLQVGLLWVFGGVEFAYHKLMNSLTGGAVCLLVCGIGIYMIYRANRDANKENT